MVSKETKEKMRIKRGLRRPARDKAPTPAAMIVTSLETNSIEGHVLLVDHSHEGMPPLQWGQVASTPKRTSKSTAKSIKRLGDIVPKQTKIPVRWFQTRDPETELAQACVATKCWEPMRCLLLEPTPTSTPTRLQLIRSNITETAPQEVLPTPGYVATLLAGSNAFWRQRSKEIME